MASKRQQLPLKVRVGLDLILVAGAFYAGVQHWFDTRTFLALETPISLSRGHITTVPFPINLRETYSILLHVDQYRLVHNPNCQDRNPAPEIRWQLFGSGHLVTQGKSSDRFADELGRFESEKGLYSLDLEVLSDASCLNAGNPMLRIWTLADYSGLYNRAVMASLMLLFAGIALLPHLRPAPDREQTIGGELPSTFRITGRARNMPHPKFLLRQQFSGLPGFGLFAATIAFLCLLPMLMIRSNHVSWGFKVALFRPEIRVAPNDPWHGPLVVRIDAENRWYLNRKEVNPEELRSRLTAELRQRADHVVYLEADERAPYSWVIQAVDKIQGTFADKIVLLTAKAR